MKKKAPLIISLIIALPALYIVGSGFTRASSAYIKDYSLSLDGNSITLNMGVSTSMGYIRDVSVHQQEGSRLYIDCYHAFGGLNGRMGAKDSFTLPLNGNTSVIAIYRAPNCYEEVLSKDAHGTWQRVEK